MEKKISMELLILPEIKEVYKDEAQMIICTYEGCGADDGWPTGCLDSEPSPSLSKKSFRQAQVFLTFLIGRERAF